MYRYKTKGTCSSHILYDIEGDVVTNCTFEGGCDGNLEGIARLIVGRTVDELIDMLRGIDCQNSTSCPDQLARALEAYKLGQGETA